MPEPTRFTTTASPLGELTLAASAEGLSGVYFELHRHGPAHREGWRRDPEDAVLREAAAQLAAYFDGELRAFELPLAPEGTEFQRRVWRALQEIPYGSVLGYGELARRLGAPDAARAVGAANGRNPISVIVPCHRVIGARGALTGYGGGLERKRWLLAHEGAIPRALDGALDGA